MYLMLSYFDKIQGPRYLITSHPYLAERVRSLVLNLMDVTQKKGFSQHTFSGEEDIKLANYIFDLESEWARGGTETIMLTVVIDPIQQTSNFKSVLTKYVDILKSEPHIFKAFYSNTTRVDPEITTKYEWLDQTFSNLIKDSEIILKEVLLGQILVVGLRNAGKTSMLNRITTKVFNPNVRPTLGIQVTKLLLENYKLHAYDVGGQVKLRDLWTRITNKPKAIVFVTDISADDDVNLEAKKFFNDVIEHYIPISKNSCTEQKPENRIPVLILGNKIDLNPDFQKNKLEELLEPQKKGICYRIGLTSAVTNIGIFQNLRWLIAQLIDFSC